ncbi:sterol desaturase family protein [Pseudomonas sp. HK3]|jgi:sterol desaturase/sphingolipid hydroxylase (fatty acid hydroxylase superfamily)
MPNFIDVIIQDYSGVFYDPWFWLFPAATLAISFIAFMTFALPWTWLAYIEPNWLKPYRIQANAIDVKGTFWPSIYHSVKNTAVVFVMLVVLWPLIKRTGIHVGDMPSVYIIVIQVLFFILLDDFLYYWMHRFFHENKFFMRHVHSVHHKIKNTCAINGNYMHWFEFACTSGLILIGPILLSSHLYVIWIWVIIRQFEAADGHIGYDIPWNPARLFLIYHGPVYHDFHHAKFKGNYAGFLNYLDGYLGNTYVKAYLEYKAKRKAGLTPQEIRTPSK